MADLTNQLQSAAGAAGGGPDSEYLAVCVDSASVGFTLLDHTSPGTLALAATYNTGGNSARSVSFSRDNDYIAAVGSSSPRFWLFNHTTRGSISLAATYSLSGSGRQVSFSPSGDYIAAIYDGGLALLNHTTPGSISLATTYTTFFNGNTTFATAFTNTNDNYIANGTQQVRFSPSFEYGPPFCVLNHTTPGSLSLSSTYGAALQEAAAAVAFFPADDYLLVTYGDDVTLLSHSAGTLTYSATYKTNYTVRERSLSILSDGDYAAIGCQDIILILNTATAGALSLASTYTESGSYFNGVAFSDGGGYLAAGTVLRSPNLVDLFNFSSGSLTLATTYSLPASCLGLAFSYLEI